MCGPDGPGQLTHPSRKVKDVIPFIFVHQGGECLNYQKAGMIAVASKHQINIGQNKKLELKSETAPDNPKRK